MSQESLTSVLSGIRVLDMTMFLSGPFGTQILGDLGAEVIKIETGDGDQTRVLPPNFIAGESAYVLSANRIGTTTLDRRVVKSGTLIKASKMRAAPPPIKAMAAKKILNITFLLLSIDGSHPW